MYWKNLEDLWFIMIYIYIHFIMIMHFIILYTFINVDYTLHMFEL